jgi:diguanylate cyclase (GGDEF)-like protein
MPPVTTANLSVVTPVSAIQQQRLDAQLRQLEFNALLHRKLDLDVLLESFLSEAQAFVPFDGLQFLSVEQALNIVRGDIRQHRQRFELKLGERVLGDLIMMRGKPFNSREERNSERIVESLIYPLNNALAHHAVMIQALTDSATGLHNQRALELQLPREIRLARRGQQTLSVMLLTVDDLDSISENHGTVVGERAWQSVADALAARLRQSDLIFRTSNDEFFVILNHTDIEGAEILADRLCQQVHRCVSHGNVQFMLSASAGITELDEGDDVDSLVTRVIAALGDARDTGRNQVRARAAEMPSGSTPGGGGAPSVA